jgi:hypothetical protein
MLRGKTAMIAKLKEATLRVARQRKQKLTFRRIEKLEDDIFRLYQVYM